MRKLLIKCFIIFNIFFFYGCNENNEPKMNVYEQIVSEYLKSNLNNPKSYEIISFKNLADTPNLVLLKHEYRATNSYNALIKVSEYFFVIKKDNKVLLVIQNNISDTFLKLIKNEYKDKNVNDNLLGLGLSSWNLLAEYNRGEDAISHFCNSVSKYTFDSIQENLKSNPPKYIDFSNVFMLFSYCNLFPNEMTILLKDSLEIK